VKQCVFDVQSSKGNNLIFCEAAEHAVQRAH